MKGREQQPEQSRLAQGIVILHAFAAGSMTLTRWNIGRRAYAPAIAFAGFLAHGFLAAVMPAPAHFASVAMPLWIWGYGLLALVHLAKQQRNQRHGTFVHSSFVGEWLADAVPALRGDGLRKVVRDVFMAAWIAWWLIALPGAGVAILLGLAAEQLLMARTRMAGAMVDQDMFDALCDAEGRQQRVEALQQQRRS